MRLTFDDLVFNPHSASPKGVQALMAIGAYEVSVVNLKGTTAPFELAIFDSQGDFVQLPGIHEGIREEFSDDVNHYLYPDDITAIMLKLQTITGTAQVNI